MGDERIMEGLTVSGLNKSYLLNGEKLNVLNNINFNLEKGGFLTILGPSGCGKSTLIRCISGIENPDSGDIRVNGTPISGIGPDRLMVFQDFNQLFPWKTVLQNIVYPLKLNRVGASQAERQEIAEKFLDLVHLSQFRDAYPNQLSGGMRQRVAIARSLALNPDILLMDEPFGALDAQTRRILQKELVQLWQEFRTTILFITHNVQEAILLGSSIMVLSHRPSKILHLEKNAMTYPREPETPDFMDLWHVLFGLLEQK